MKKAIRKVACLAAFALASNATVHAVTINLLTNFSTDNNDPYYLGWIDNGSASLANEATGIINLHKQVIGYLDAAAPATTVSRENSDVAQLLTANIISSFKQDNNTVTNSLDGTVDYVLGKYAGISHVWYVNGLVGNISVPSTTFGGFQTGGGPNAGNPKDNGLSHTSYFRSSDPDDGGGGKVPDGGTTLLSLGVALLGLGSMRKLLAAKA